MEARDNINLALRELEIKLSSAEESADTYKGLLEQMSSSMPYTLPGSGGEIDTLNEEAMLDEMPSNYQPEEAAAPAEPAPAEPEPEKPAEEKKNRFSWF